MIELIRDGAVFVLTMRAGENRFNDRFVDALEGAVDEVERAAGAAALVTVGEDKFYSNGLDLDWLTAAAGDAASTFVRRFLRFLGRWLVLPVPTVAALNGHAFAGGAMFALAHDVRVMRADRGFFCLPEVDIGLPFAPGMMALNLAKLDPAVGRDLMLSGRRIGGTEALALRVIDDAVPADEVIAHATARAQALAGKSRETYGAIKRAMYRTPFALLDAGAMTEAP